MNFIWADILHYLAKSLAIFGPIQYTPLPSYCLGGALVGSLQEPITLALAGPVAVAVALLKAALIWCTVLHKWLLMAVTLERSSFADGIVLARTWSTTVSRQPEEVLGALILESSSDDGLPSLEMLAVSAVADPAGTMTNPMGRRGMQEGSSPLIASWIESTSMVVYATRLPDSSVQLSCSISSTCWAELLATCMHAHKYIGIDLHFDTYTMKVVCICVLNRKKKKKKIHFHFPEDAN